MTLWIHDFVTRPRKPRNLLLPLRSHKLFKVVNWTSGGSSDPDQPRTPADIEETDDLNEADVISSRMISDPDVNLHSPVLDIDIPAMLIPSTTPGHWHLYLDAPMPWDTYVQLLDAMADAGILEEGYVAASKARGFTAVRLPWISK